MTNGNDPIKSERKAVGGGRDGFGNFTTIYDGMTIGLTKREYFASMALQGLLARGDDGDSAEGLIRGSVAAADKLIEELNK
jgi:hypothetical protein